MKDWTPLHEALPELTGFKIEVESVPPTARPGDPPSEFFSSKARARKPWIGRLIKAIFFLALLAGAGTVWKLRLANPLITDLMSQIAERDQRALRFLSDVPDLNELNPADLEALRKASIPESGNKPPKLAVVSSPTDLNQTLYLASNLPDGSVFELQLVGIPDTLIGSLEATATLKAKLEKHFARIGMSPLPTGSYRVLVKFPGADSSAPVAQSRALFIGRQDENYQKGLKDFHAKIRAQAVQESADIRMIAQLMEDQLLTAQKRLSAHGGRITRHKKGSGHEWDADIQKLNDALTRWSDPDFQKTCYYSSLFQLAIQTAQSFLQYNDIQNQLADGSGDASSLQIRAGETLSVAQSAVINLKSKLDFAERIFNAGAGSGADELPSREGL